MKEPDGESLGIIAVKSMLGRAYLRWYYGWGWGLLGGTPRACLMAGFATNERVPYAQQPLDKMVS